MFSVRSLHVKMEVQRGVQYRITKSSARWLVGGWTAAGASYSLLNLLYCSEFGCSALFGLHVHAVLLYTVFFLL